MQTPPSCFHLLPPPEFKPPFTTHVGSHISLLFDLPASTSVPLSSPQPELIRSRCSLRDLLSWSKICTPHLRSYRPPGLRLCLVLAISPLLTWVQPRWPLFCASRAEAPSVLRDFVLADASARKAISHVSPRLPPFCH